MADQILKEEGQTLWVDLHDCETGYARELFSIKTEEAFLYGLACVEFIYGTPDQYEGSIEEAYDEQLKQPQDYVKGTKKIHAGLEIHLNPNPNHEPHDD
jgi:hypothetical protein